MRDKRKKLIKIISEAAVIFITVIILCFIFKDSYKDIAKQLGHTDMLIFAGIAVLGNMYYIIDAVVYKILFKRENYRLSFPRCILVSYMSIFFNVTTFGAGIKPGQVLYLSRKGIEPGKGLAITTVPYVYHKAVIVGYAIIMLLSNLSFVRGNFGSAIGYIYIGAGLNMVLITVIILLCTAEWFHRLVYRLLNFIFRKPKYQKIKEKIWDQTAGLRVGTKELVGNAKMWLPMIAINVVKMTCWYVIPIIAIYASDGNIGTVTITQAITVTAIMQLIMGVIPTAGGVGSLEVVFSLVFEAVFGKVMAGASMVLYRLTTYYIPFLISIALVAVAQKDGSRPPDAIEYY